MVRAIAVWQQSHTRGSRRCVAGRARRSGPTWQTGAPWSCCVRAVSRPSRQRTPMRRPGPARRRRTRARKVSPRGRDGRGAPGRAAVRETHELHVVRVGPAARVLLEPVREERPVRSAARRGKSAQFTNQEAPSATVRGTDQGSPALREEKRSAWRPPSRGSSQLRITRPSAVAARLGSPLPGAAGGSIGRATAGIGARPARTARLGRRWPGRGAPRPGARRVP